MAEADFEAVASLGATIWRLHYSTIVSMAQIDYMLAERYSPANLHKYLGSDGRWFELLRLGEVAVGYCSYSLTANPGEMKLEQIYLVEGYRGKGLGGFMLRHVEAEARKKNIRLLMLQVNKRNECPIAIYRRAGFRVREEAVFDIGNGYFMDDYVMEKTI
ncbi:MAG: GNAT family N-acetyltransferase [Sideroxyarcus sp.]|nr:GNAT family N-acetyltransferase [Sideroxyarcus sp.]